jgi:hypothetical protein
MGLQSNFCFKKCLQQLQIKSSKETTCASTLNAVGSLFKTDLYNGISRRSYLFSTAKQLKGHRFRLLSTTPKTSQHVHLRLHTSTQSVAQSTRCRITGQIQTHRLPPQSFSDQETNSNLVQSSFTIQTSCPLEGVFSSAKCQQTKCWKII